MGVTGTDPAGASSGGESLKTVVIAFAANLVIAIAKSFAAVVTGSASMLAEAAHSWADTGNEIFLLVADRRSGKGRDARHPMGYGREAYVWSMFAAFGLFTAGAVVSISHGITELRNPEEASDFAVAYVVLALSFVLEGVSFTQAVLQTRRSARRLGRRFFDHVLNTSVPTLRAVFFEDAAALLGILIAATGVALHQVTGSAVPDAVGSILVGVLLGVVAVVLIERNRRFLVGENVRPEVRTHVLERLLQRTDVDRVTYLHLEFLGPSRLYLVAAVDMAGDDVEHRLAGRLRRLERLLEEDDLIEEAVLTLATPEEPALRP
ncbi:cation diffusion facilitator family transporter [Friedmanniella luteola]|uniref:Cation diffusion facilitator family transporter n=1 Tax=Friedmanniella luteola TaxID=546871 RepID=A0A1H1PXI0_9ACTN|nr:cation diffusion facilitator family transporter [Friedmanniella luteola]